MLRLQNKEALKVTRLGLENAASAAAMLLTTEAAVAEEPKAKSLSEDIERSPSSSL